MKHVFALRFFLTLGVLLLMLAVLVSPAAAATLCVKPGGGGGCYATIQAAVNAANTGDLIDIAAGTYVEHDIVLDKNLELHGAGDSTLVDANRSGRAFSIPAKVTAALSNLQIANGKSDNLDGGAIWNAGSLRLDSVALYENTAVIDGTDATRSGGAAIYNAGTLNLTKSLVRKNTVKLLTADRNNELTQGGALFNAGTATVTESTFQENPTDDGHFSGAGILNGEQGNLSVDRSEFLNNGTLHEGEGGAVFNQGIAAIADSTFRNNQASCAGAIQSNKELTVTRSRFKQNKGFG